MKGLDSFEINREMTLDDLAQFMEQHWNREEYGGFVVGDPRGTGSGTKYIVLPASEGCARYDR